MGNAFLPVLQDKRRFNGYTIPYFKTGLENNEYCLWTLSESIDKEKAKETLKAAIPDINAYLQSGQIEIVPYTYWPRRRNSLDPQVEN